MKKLLRIFTQGLALSAVAFLAASCGIFGVNMTDQSSIDKNLRKGIEKHIDPESRIASIRLGDSGDFVKSLGIATVDLFEPGSDQLMSYAIELGGNQEPRIRKATGSNSVTPGTAKKLADFDFSNIASYVNSAAEIIEAEELPFDGIGYYKMGVNPSTGSVEHSFALESKVGSENTTRGGRLAIQINYHEIEFVVGVDGELMLKE